MSENEIESVWCGLLVPPNYLKNANNASLVH